MSDFISKQNFNKKIIEDIFCSILTQDLLQKLKLPLKLDVSTLFFA